MLKTLAAETEAFSASSFPLLSMLVVVPLIGAITILLTTSRRPEFAKLIALVASVATGAMSIYLLRVFDTGDDGFQFGSQHDWIAQWGIGWHLGVDGISLFLVVLTGLLFPLAIVGIDPHHGEGQSDKPYLAWLLMLEAGVMGSFLSLDLFLFFLFFEIVLVPMYFLIGQWGHGARAYAATKFFVYTMFGSALMLVGILATAFLTASETGNAVSFDLVYLAEEQALATTTARWIYLSFALAFAVKVPLFPVHTWLPDAHTNAPTAGSVILAGVMLKLGTYGFLRFGIYLFPEAAVFFAPALVALGTIGILYGAIAATMQKDLKRLVAYSSVAHSGYMLVGVIAGPGSAFTESGIAAVLFYLLAYGIMNTGAFAVVSALEARQPARTDTGHLVHDEAHEPEPLPGLCRHNPVLGWSMVLCALSLLGFPLTLGFFGKLPLFTAGIDAGEIPLVIVLGINSAIAAFYYLRLVALPLFEHPGDEAEAYAESPYHGRRAAGIIAAGGVLVLTVLASPLMDAAFNATVNTSAIVPNEATPIVEQSASADRIETGF